MPTSLRHHLGAMLTAVAALSCDGNPGSLRSTHERAPQDVPVSGRDERISPRDVVGSPNGGSGGGFNLAALRLFGGPDTFGRVQEIRPVGKHLVVTDRGGPPHVIVFDRVSGQIERRFGASGSGPREFRGVHWLYTVSHEPPRAWLYDYINRRVSLLDLDAPDSLFILDQFRVEVVGAVTSPAVLGDTVVAGGHYPDLTLLVFDRDQNVLSRIVGDLPFTVDDVREPVALMQLNTNATAFNPSRTRVAIAYQRVNRVDFFRIDGMKYAAGTSPRAIPRPTYRFTPSGGFLWEEMTPVYVDVDASDRYVFALFKGSETGADGSTRLSHRLDVYYWTGEFVAELLLDHDLNEIAVSENDSLLYGATQEPYPAVVEWELPAWLREGRLEK